MLSQVATPGGKEAANAGLHVVDTAPGVDIGAVFQQAASEQPEEFDYSTDVDTEKGLEFVGAIFAKLSGVSVDLTVSAAESWRPDVVVYSSMEGTGPLVAAKLGVPAVSHGFGFADEASMTEAIFKKMVEERERHGVQGFPEVRESIADSINLTSCWAKSPARCRRRRGSFLQYQLRTNPITPDRGTYSPNGTS